MGKSVQVYIPTQHRVRARRLSDGWIETKRGTESYCQGYYDGLREHGSGIEITLEAKDYGEDWEISHHTTRQTVMAFGGEPR